MAKKAPILMLPQNAWGNDAWFAELTDNPGCFFHLVSRKKDGKLSYMIRQGHIGAAVFTQKAGEKFLKSVRNKYPNAKLTPLRDVVGNDGTAN